jgi:alkylhydroperoxidase family enzyme
MNGFTEEQIIELRKADITFDSKLNALAQFTKSVVINKGKADQQAKDLFFQAGYTEANMIDVVFVVGDKIISNYIHNLADFPIDFPLAPIL